MSKLTLKEKVFAKCLEVISSKLFEIKEAQAAISESANNESKSTAGDKHETGRAMLQLEQEKLGNQLKESEALEDELKKINITQGNKICGKGSLILTNKGYLFLSIGLGKITVDGITVYALSMQSPLGAKLAGFKANDNIEMNGVVYQIKEIL